MNIKNIRNDKSISLSILHKKTGISITHINDIENNYKMPSLLLGVKLAEALNVNITDLYKIKI